MRKIGHQPERRQDAEDIAKDFDVEVLTIDPLKRDRITVYVPPAAMAQTFTLPEKDFGSAASGEAEGRIVSRSTRLRPRAARCGLDREAEATVQALDRGNSIRNISAR